MDVMLQRHCAKHIYVVPEGLKELMSDISREVLRSKPENLYTFIADYLDALIITRENARVAAKLVQSITEITITTCEFLQTTGMSRPEADRIVTIIQKAFRKHLQDTSTTTPQLDKTEFEELNIISDVINEANISPEQSEEAARIIQQAFRNFKQRHDKEKELLSGMIDWRVAARSAIRLYKKTGVTNEEAKRAATLIKAAYKGYYTRRVMKQLASESRMLPEVTLEVHEEKPIGGIRSSDVKTERVKIDYDTVIPHVNFGDSDFIAPEFSTTSVIASYAIEQVIESTIQIAENKLQNAVTADLLHEELTLEEAKKSSEVDEIPLSEPIEAQEMKIEDGQVAEEDLENLAEDLPITEAITENAEESNYTADDANPEKTGGTDEVSNQPEATESLTEKIYAIENETNGLLK